MKSTLTVSSLLVGGAGFLAVYTWIVHGHVFANAQTGNIVQFCATALQGDWAQASRHVPPMLAFFPGVIVAQWVRQHRTCQGLGNAAVASLCVEIVILLVIALLPAGFPDAPITFGIAFAAALQNSTFERVEGWSYTSVVTTGNLRSAGEALYAAIMSKGRSKDRKARVFATICTAFTAGAAVGAAITVAFGKGAIAIPIAMLALALLCSLRDARGPDPHG